MPPFNHAQYTALWCRQLEREFSQICFGHQLELAMPIFEIFDSAQHLGQWHQVTRTIKISSVLIRERPWVVTINILKHEMAHQLCDSLGQREAGHGPLFQEACRRLGVPPAYRTAGGDTPELFMELEMENEMVASGRRFFAKVEKLLALARSANEHEAALAMHKANELISKYNLQQQADDADRRYRHLVINSGLKRLHGWQRTMAIILRDFFFVRIVLAEAYDPLRDEHHKTIDLFGLLENVAVAEYCYHFLERELAFLWQNHRAQSRRGGITEKHSYYHGVLHGFQQTLATQQQTVRAAGQPSSPAGPGPSASVGVAVPFTSALVVAADQQLDEFLALRYPRLRTRRHSGPRVNPATYDHGCAAGKSIVLNKGVAHQDGNRGHLLPE
jgi:hypothetical protein